MLTRIDEELAKVREQLMAAKEAMTELQSKRRLDLDLCHVRAAGMSAEIEKLEVRLQPKALEQIRDRVLLRQPPNQRRAMKKVLDEFIRALAG